MKKISKRRRGIMGVLAMLYLVLFSALALGFYGAVTASVQVSKNDRDAGLARIAAESGMQFIRYQLADMNIPRGTPAYQLFYQVYTQLGVQMNGTSNLGADTVGMLDGTIYIPGNPSHCINVDSSGTRFRCTIAPLGQQLRVTVTGYGPTGGLSRTIQLDYGIAQRASAIFDYGVASKSAITMNGNVAISGATDPAQGSVLSATYSTATPITMIGSSSISGDVSMVNPSANISVSSSSSIAGSTNPSAYASHVHSGVEMPDFPTVDTDDFAPYATTNITASKPSGKTFSNIRIKAGTNPSFQANTTITGVVYIETPNHVSFAGNLNIKGVIVVQNNPTGDTTTNSVDFGGNVSATGVETLPSTFGNLRNLKGGMLLAPNFTATFRGNFGTISGSILASKTSFTGNSGGTVKGSVINLDDTAMDFSGSTAIKIESTGTSNYPAGVYFGSNYAPLPATYTEVHP